MNSGNARFRVWMWREAAAARPEPTERDCWLCVERAVSAVHVSSTVIKSCVGLVEKIVMVSLAPVMPLAASASGSQWIPLVYAIVLIGGFATWCAYRWLGVGRTRGLIVRAAQQALVDPAFADQTPVAACCEELGEIVGSHPRRAMITALRRLISDDAAYWLTTIPPDFDEVIVGELRGCDVVRVLERDSERPPRVVVRIVVQLTATHGRRRCHRQVESYWTMTRLNGIWRRAAREDGLDAVHHLHDDPLTSTETDGVALRDHVVIAPAATDHAPADLIEAAGDVVGRAAARAAALELSQADERFDPNVIAASVRAVLRAWEDATNGQPRALDAVTTEHARRQLLGPARGLPKTAREPTLTRCEVVELDGRARPPIVAVLATVRAHPYMSHLDLCWKLSLADDAVAPWQRSNAVAAKDAYYYSGH